ncbi:histidine phosphatase family protein [Tessaracoccus sp. Z1128]
MRLEHSTRLLVLRHGQTDWNAQQRFQGLADVPLNDVGRRQAEDARAALADVRFDAVYASPLSRAVDTATLVRPGEPVRTDPRLMEIDVGSWAGLTWDEVKASMPDYESKYANGVDFRRSPEGETLADVVARGLPAFEEIAGAHAGGTVLVVSHGLLLNRIIHALLGLEGRVLGGLGNAHFSELGLAHGAWRLVAHNVGIFHPTSR